MEREIVLTEYDGERHKYKIGNFENVFMIRINIKSGDEIAEIIYNDKSIKRIDCSDSRIMGFDDGSYILPLEKLDEFNKFNGSSYERRRKFAEYYY